IKGIQDLFNGLRKIQDEDIQKQFPDHIQVSVTRATTGEALARLAYNSDGHLFHADEDISSNAKEVSASIFDYLRDLGDISDEASFSERLSYERELDGMLKELESLGCACYFASRATNIVGKNWIDKTPMPFTAGYLTVVSADKKLTEIMVPRRFS